MGLAVRAAAASCSSYPSFQRARVPGRRSPGLPQLPARRVAVAAAIAVDPIQDIKTEQNDVSKTEVFACPVCYEPLIRKGPPGMNLSAIYRSGFKCLKCNKSYTSKDIFLDLTVTSGAKEYIELKPARTELFRSPLVSFLYERGWRQNFNRSGFPGRDEEMKDCFHDPKSILLRWSEASFFVRQGARVNKFGSKDTMVMKNFCQWSHRYTR